MTEADVREPLRAVIDPEIGGNIVGLGLLVVAVASVTYGVWLGLVRLGWALPLAWPDQLVLHGPLMIGGFLGTLIGLERAIGLARRWAYAAPICSAAATLLLVSGRAMWPGALLMTASSVIVVIILLVVLRRRFSLFALTMIGGAVCWMVGNARWTAGASIYRVVFWWAAFLVLTIAGERLELNRVLRPSPLVRTTFLGAVLVVIGGAASMEWSPPAGAALTGIGLMMLAAWLARNDVARRTVHADGATRFIALCLLTGYIWLGVAGFLLLTTSATSPGTAYDAVLHSIFVGFVLSMIFGHGPVVFPAMLGVAVRHRAAAYAPLAVLHASLLLRIVGDLVEEWGRLRAWGAAGNAAALVLFVAVAAGSTAINRPQPAWGEPARR